MIMIDWMSVRLGIVHLHGTLRVRQAAAPFHASVRGGSAGG
jgi:hypothetical protein